MDAFDEWFEESHKCDIRQIDDFYYCDTHDDIAYGTDALCQFAKGNPLPAEADCLD